MPYGQDYLELRQKAREMRSDPTEAEAVLWEALRRRQVGGFRFRRQHIIGRLIVDFFCPSTRLVVEVDGPVHQKQIPYDKERTRWLSERGYLVIRFTNEHALTELDQVLKKIRVNCEQRVR